jgi:hypothetical protein
VRDLQHLLAQPGAPLRAADVGGTLEGLRTAINRANPHYRYEPASPGLLKGRWPGTPARTTQGRASGWQFIRPGCRWPGCGPHRLLTGAVDPSLQRGITVARRRP